MKSLSKTFRAEIEALPEVTEFIISNIGDVGFSMKTMTQLEIAIEEIYVNIAHYAYPGSEGTAGITVETDGNTARIVFSDSGIPFDPLAKEDPDITLGAEDRPIGGLGIFLVKKIMDEVSYEYRDGKNVLTLTKTGGSF